MFVIFTLINFVCYFLILKVGYIIFNNKYVFPFRLAEVFTLILSILIFPILSLNFFNLTISIFTFLINFTFFVIFFFLLSMIYTSPRTKILIDIYEKKKINKRKYLKYYNENRIVNNRIRRFKSNNEIIIKKNSITLNNKTNRYTLLSLVIFVFQKMKTI
jgi:hypothetical protein